jgi:alpha-methylacyl-CoA racemase
MRPLDGINVIEMAGYAPAPYCGMILSDFGARVVLVDRILRRPEDDRSIMPVNPFEFDKRRIRVDLKEKEGTDLLMRMIGRSDVLIEPYRPGVMESFGLGPEEALNLNPRLIYARLTGWGQEGVLAQGAGHDMNYIALSGVLSLFRRKNERPVPPCNLLGDFAGGGLICALGILLALIERGKSGKGQVVDAAMVDGISYLSTLFHGLFANRMLGSDQKPHFLQGGSPFYQVYETKDGKFIAVAAVEPKFYAQLLEGLGIEASHVSHQNDPRTWPEMVNRLAGVFRSRSRDEWVEIFAGKDACLSPVLSLGEVEAHPQIREREVLVQVQGFPRPAPAPRLSRTPGEPPPERGPLGTQSREILKEVGYSGAQIQEFVERHLIQ